MTPFISPTRNNLSSPLLISPPYTIFLPSPPPIVAPALCSPSPHNMSTKDDKDFTSTSTATTTTTSSSPQHKDAKASDDQPSSFTTTTTSSTSLAHLMDDIIRIIRMPDVSKHHRLSTILTTIIHYADISQGSYLIIGRLTMIPWQMLLNEAIQVTHTPPSFK